MDLNYGPLDLIWWGPPHPCIQLAIEKAEQQIRAAYRERENKLAQRILRGIHNDQAEYVWSEILYMYVRIGESLKVK